jgi:hypothetical protein
VFQGLQCRLRTCHKCKSSLAHDSKLVAHAVARDLCMIRMSEYELLKIYGGFFTYENTRIQHCSLLI